ncbi:hypothetical protein Nepgr_011682 [Nepenthes gracilis]|uniref:Uncharacterized protein n=1 Tax=Nepenthes gracilis TaxID=150966 RepID=A0AAD3XMK9_NEPGR|nr:hypothetical protein Nepgr_011682 [Nepenthes gracilis]
MLLHTAGCMQSFMRPRDANLDPCPCSLPLANFVMPPPLFSEFQMSLLDFSVRAATVQTRSSHHHMELYLPHYCHTFAGCIHQKDTSVLNLVMSVPAGVACSATIKAYFRIPSYSTFFDSPLGEATVHLGPL